MLFLLRLWLAQILVHPLEGITFGDWLRLLRKERYRIPPWRWPRAAWITALSLLNSLAARRVARRFGPAIASAHVDAPIFILGHYRSGTTHLHEILAADPRFASPDRFQTFNPSTFLLTERWRKPLVEPFMLPRRVQEDEVASMNLSGLSPYLDWVFPRSMRGYERTLTFRDASPSEVAEWSSSIVAFLKAMTVKTGRRLILKSPPHTARIRLLLELFPDAQFVHIRRDPYPVFLSTIGLLKAIQPVFRLQDGPWKVDEDAVLRTYKTMYDAYFDDRYLIPPGRLVEIAYEDLDRDPLGQIRAIYEGLSLPSFEEVRPAMEAYLASVSSYQKARHPKLDDARKARVAEACARSFDAWGYPR